MTKRAARPDEARAANNLLRLALEGRICLYLRPPFYQELSDKWNRHPEVEQVINIQALEEDEELEKPWLGDEENEDDEEDEEEDEGNDEDSEDDESDSDDHTTVRTNKFALLADEWIVRCKRSVSLLPVNHLLFQYAYIPPCIINLFQLRRFWAVFLVLRITIFCFNCGKWLTFEKRIVLKKSTSF